MNKILKTITGLVATTLFIGCVPAPKPQVGTNIGTAIGASSSVEYGVKPYHYASSIKSYFSTKIKRASSAQYKFSEPKRAYKQKGFAYGGEVDWKGWLVETSVATTSRSGRLLTPKPYLVLFKGEQVVEHILGNSHKLVTKIDK